ncbi:hypothetical protein ACWEOW_09705 [Monashia sp. NPDC004114]
MTGELRRDGHAVAGRLMVRVWPLQQILSALPEGDSFTTPVVSRQAIPASGRFAVTVDPSALPARYLGSGDQVDLELIVSDGVSQASWFTSVVRAEKDQLTQDKQRSRVWVPASARNQAGNEIVTLDIGKGTADAASSPKSRQAGADGRLGSPVLGTRKLAVERTSAKGWDEPALGQTSPAVPMETCVTSSGPLITNLPDAFAHVYAWSGSKGTVDFDTGSNHTLGIGSVSLEEPRHQRHVQLWGGHRPRERICTVGVECGNETDLGHHGQHTHLRVEQRGMALLSRPGRP